MGYKLSKNDPFFVSIKDGISSNAKINVLFRYTVFWASCFECEIGVVHGQNVKKQTMLFTEKNKTQLVDRTSLIFDKNKKLD